MFGKHRIIQLYNILHKVELLNIPLGNFSPSLAPLYFKKKLYFNIFLPFAPAMQASLCREVLYSRTFQTDFEPCP